MTREEATNCLADLLDAYNADWHGDYFYDNSDAVCDAVVFFMENRPRWISVEERLPEKSCRYLSAVETTGYVGTRYFYETCPEAFTMNQACTHWMPLPEPPKEEV